ncbi:MAG: hypothetical protein D3910_25675 [Candidatus Electrothrix sp. ATG2]|nr:hypothetical protein [Candidatus Electrothrix sp. ATG2]
MQSDQWITLNSDFATEVFEDEILLYAIATGKGVYMNKTAGLVLEMCGMGQAVEEVISQLEDAFPELSSKRISVGMWRQLFRPCWSTGLSSPPMNRAMDKIVQKKGTI